MLCYPWLRDSLSGLLVCSHALFLTQSHSESSLARHILLHCLSVCLCECLCLCLSDCLYLLLSAHWFLAWADFACFAHERSESHNLVLGWGNCSAAGRKDSKLIPKLSRSITCNNGSWIWLRYHLLCLKNAEMGWLQKNQNFLMNKYFNFFVELFKESIMIPQMSNHVMVHWLLNHCW